MYSVDNESLWRTCFEIIHGLQGVTFFMVLIVRSNAGKLMRKEFVSVQSLTPNLNMMAPNAPETDATAPESIETVTVPLTTFNPSKPKPPPPPPPPPPPSPPPFTSQPSTSFHRPPKSYIQPIVSVGESSTSLTRPSTSKSISFAGSTGSSTPPTRSPSVSPTATIIHQVLPPVVHYQPAKTKKKNHII